MDAGGDFGKRIVEAAWMAVGAHLRAVEMEQRRRATGGGAAHSQVKDDVSPLAMDRTGLLTGRSSLWADGDAG